MGACLNYNHMQQLHPSRIPTTPQSFGCECRHTHPLPYRIVDFRSELHASLLGGIRLLCTAKCRVTGVSWMITCDGSVIDMDDDV
jgi:hypothetical protein